MLTFNEIIESFSRAVPTKVVVKDENRKLSYKELETNGTKLSNYFLKLGISKGDRIALLAYNCIEYAEIFYATSKIGAIITPINFRLSLKEVLDVWNDSSPSFLIIQNSFQEIYFELLNKKIIDTKKLS